MCKEGLLFRLGQEGCVRMGELPEIPEKGGGTEMRGGETKILERGWGHAGSRGGCLKKGGWNPLTSYE